MKIEGIVIEANDYKETSKIVTLYTNIGFVSVKAIGAKKTKGGSLGFITIGNIISCIISDTKLPTLIEYEIIDSIFDITNDLNRIKAFQVMLKVIKHIPIENNHDKIYDYIKQALIDLKTKDALKLLSIFLIKMLYPYGIVPNLKECAICHNKTIVFLDLKNGLSYCGNCQNKNNIDLYNIFTEYYYLKKDINDYNNYEYNLLLSYLRDYYLNYASIDIRFK